jgi:hypothetical protein
MVHLTFYFAPLYQILMHLGHPWLQDLGVRSSVNDGVFHGSWEKGKGAVVDSINPNAQTTIGSAAFGTVDDYETCVKNAIAAQKEWGQVLT